MTSRNGPTGSRLACPACGSDMRRQGSLTEIAFRSHRICPDCQQRCIFDSATRRRGLLIGVFGCITFLVCYVSFARGFPWGLLAFLCGVGLLGYTGYTLSRAAYVKADD